MTEKERMLAGLPYRPSDPALRGEHLACAKKLRAYNELGPWDPSGMDRMIRSILGGAGKNLYITPPFHCDYGGNIFIGDDFYANFNLVILDVARVRIGHRVMFGPNVGLYSAGHPIHPKARNSGWEWGQEIVIGDDVWLGGHVAVNPGVTIGESTVVGAGTVVTKDLPAWTFCAGSPCRVIRPITEEDRRFYRKNLTWPSDAFS